MPLKRHQSKIIALFVAQELLLAELYGLFARFYPEHLDFWETLVHEELEHAEWVEYFAQKVPAGDMGFFEDSVRTYTVESFTAYVKKTIAEVTAHRPLLEKAFSLALDIEKALLEKNVFDHFQTVSPDLNALLRNLKIKTLEHCRMVQQKTASLLTEGVHA